MDWKLFIARRIYRSNEGGKEVSKPAVRIAMLGIAIGLAVMIVSVAVVIGFKHEVRDKVVGLGADIVITNFDSQQSYQTVPIVANDSLLHLLKTLEGVKHVQRYSTKPGMIMTSDSFQGMVRLIQWVLKVTLCFEGAGAVLSFLTFSQDYPLPRALWTSVFHSVAAFNNSGFDILGGMQNLIPYQSDVLLNLVTCALIIFGGLGFLVMLDIRRAGSFRKLTFHSKVVITTTAALLAVGTLLLKATEDMTWLGAFFHSVSARTAGFSTYSMGELTNAGLFTLILLMFIGASPGSTGGGIKTTTFFALMQQVRAVFTKKKPGGFHRTLPGEAIDKAGVIALLSVVVVCVGTFLLCVLEPELDFVRLLFEEVSAFGTVGLSTGITPDLSVASKLVLIFTMYIGRLGAFTLFSLWIDRPDPSIRYTEEMITIG